MGEILSGNSIISLQNKAESIFGLMSEKCGGKTQAHQPSSNKEVITRRNHENLTKKKCKVWKIKSMRDGMLR